MQNETDARIALKARDRVSYITIKRPEAKNAMTMSMYGAIRDACAAAADDPSTDIVVLRGWNGAFATGGDLKEILQILESEEPTAILKYERFLPFETVRSTSKPTVAYIDGLCLGGGLMLALMCDILIASDRSRFGMPEAKFGIVDGHLPRLLREAIPPARLRYWIYTGALFSAKEAYEVGLVTRVVPAGELAESLNHCLKELKASSQEAIRACKRILSETRQLSSMADAYVTLLQPAVQKRLQRFRDR